MNLSHRWFLESARWLVLRNKSDLAIKNLKSVAKFNGRQEEGDKIDMKVSGVFWLSITPCSCVGCLKRPLSLCIDAAGVHEEGDVLFKGVVLCLGSVPHTHNEDDDRLPQCCLVHVKKNSLYLFRLTLH